MQGCHEENLGRDESQHQPHRPRGGVFLMLSPPLACITCLSPVHLPSQFVKYTHIPHSIHSPFPSAREDSPDN